MVWILGQDSYRSAINRSSEQQAQLEQTPENVCGIRARQVNLRRMFKGKVFFVPLLFLSPDIPFGFLPVPGFVVDKIILPEFHG